MGAAYALRQRKRAARQVLRHYAGWAEDPLQTLRAVALSAGRAVSDRRWLLQRDEKETAQKIRQGDGAGAIHRHHGRREQAAHAAMAKKWL